MIRKLTFFYVIPSALFLLPVGCETQRDVRPPSVAAEAANDPTALLREAVRSPARTDKERARDGARHPVETLAFFGLKNDMNVVELWPGGGYYTAILASYLHGKGLDGKGKLTITHFDPNGDPKAYDTKSAKAILARFAASPEAFGRVAPLQIAGPTYALGPDGSADAVLTFRNLHNWIEGGSADAVLSAAFRVLKSGGILGIEEHRGQPGMTREQIVKTGYVPEATVIALAQAAGFHLAGRSEINANPRDTKDYAEGVWSLPPSFAEKDKDREKYAAIGESDRLTMRFVKP